MAPSAIAEMRPISGVCPVLATPFDDDGDPDARGLARIADFAICCGADAIVYPGVASALSLAPVFVLFLLLEPFLVSGMTHGAVAN